MNTTQQLSSIDSPASFLSRPMVAMKRFVSKFLFSLGKARKFERIFEEAPTNQAAVKSAMIELNDKVINANFSI